ncbi:MAG: hypothetical protein A2Y66_05560 [Nitrospirae bacterium RBG_13_41_22]|nr:MAG: hypothetical protein A2Y66_05560 [Nitrospirae bacterium RBG_13_41_22]
MLLNRLVQVSLILITIATLASCITPRIYKMVTPFDEREFAPYSGDGTSTIQGQAFLKTRGGEVRYAAGNTVTLIPATSYSREIWQASLRGEFLSNKDPRWYNYVREVIADGFGNFEFKNIPAGEYYIECPIFWEVPGQYGLQSTGAVVKKEIKALPNQTVKLILTQ